MTTQRSLAALVALFLAGCSDVTKIPDPNAPNAMVLDRRSAALVASDSFNLPIEFPSGLAYTLGPTGLYLSTLSGFRDTYIIDRVSRTSVGTIPAGGNPRDVTFSFFNDILNPNCCTHHFFYADVGGFVRKTDLLGSTVATYPLPFRGGALATWRDTLYVGDLDSQDILVMLINGTSVRTFNSGIRPEAMVLDSLSTNLWALTLFDSYVYEIDVRGNLITKCLTPFNPGPYGLGGLAIVDNDTFYIAQARNGDPTQGTTIHVVARQDLDCGLPVEILIRGTGASGGRINPKGGMLRVVVLGNASINAAQIDVASVRFGHTGTEAAAKSSNLQDVDKDGRTDLVVWFNVGDTGIVCGDVSAHLSGKTTGGQTFNGSAPIQTVGCKP